MSGCGEGLDRTESAKACRTNRFDMSRLVVGGVVLVEISSAIRCVFVRCKVPPQRLWWLAWVAVHVPVRWVGLQAVGPPVHSCRNTVVALESLGPSQMLSSISV